MNKMKNIFFVFSILFCSLVYAAETPAFDFSPVSEENISLVLYDTETQKNVLSINAEKPFLYASNLKLLTSAAALKHLGGGFKFLTLFSFDKESGTLYIKAGGDPEMVIEKLWVVASDLRRLGVKGIKKVTVDDFLYGKKSALTAESGDKGDNGYLAFISPLSLNYNAVAIFVKATEAGQPADVSLSAPSSFFSVKNSAVGTPDGNELIKHSIELAHFKNIHVVAEGVENLEQLTFLRKLGCDSIQGYYYSPPLNHEDCMKLFESFEPNYSL